MEPDPNLGRIYDELKTIRDQLRDMTSSISSDISRHSNFLTELSSSQKAHERESKLILEGLEARFKKTEADIERAFVKIRDTEIYWEAGSKIIQAKVQKFEDAQQQVEGARKVYMILVSLAGFTGLLFGLYHLFGGK